MELYDNLKKLISRKKPIELSKLLRGIDINNRLGNDRLTLVYTSVINDDENVLKFLIGKGANINIGNYNGITPLHMAAQENRMACLQLLLAAGAEVNNKDNNFSIAPIHIAINRGHVAAVEELIQFGADINLAASVPDFTTKLGDPDSNIPDSAKTLNYTPLQYAAFVNNSEIVQILLQHGAIIDHTNKELQNPFTIALANRITDIEILRALIAHGSTVNIVYEEGVATPLYRAVYNNNLEAVQLLIASGANVNLCKRYNECPLSNASQLGHYEIAVELIRAGADVNNVDTRNRCAPLHFACQNNHLNIAIELIRAGANVNHIDLRNNSALVIAFFKGYVPITNYLIDSGADMNILLRCSHNYLNIALLDDMNINIAILFISKGFPMNAEQREKLIEKAKKVPCMCGKSRKYLCSGCDIHGYCSKKCRRQDWGRHQQVCRHI